jgi:hypothetical protein
MKKLLFSLVMMFALVVLAKSAIAQGTAIAPYQGQTYTYTLNNIVMPHAGTATIDFGAATGWILSNVSLGATSPYTVPLATTSISFKIAFGASASSGKVTVTLTDGTSNCSNYITLNIVPVAPPTLSLIVATASPAAICQTTNNTTNNTAASVGASNTFTYTVTPTMSTGGTSFAFKFKLNDYLLGASAISVVYSGTGTATGGPNSEISVSGATGVQTFTVTFATTTGVATETITGTASNAVLTVGGTGTGTYIGTIPTNDVNVDVKSLPSIGIFTY